MQLDILMEAGMRPAMIGLALSYQKHGDGMEGIARKLYERDNTGENKFLEHIMVWFKLRAPRYFWQQFDTYRVGVSKQSESTMHTILKRELTQNDFENPIFQPTLEHLNKLIDGRDFHRVKIELSEGFLQTREIVLSYKTLRRIIRQRRDHRLPEWQYFCRQMETQLLYPEFIK